MARSHKQEGNPANRRVEGPDAVIPKRRERNPDAASRLSIEKARVGRELSADPLPYDELESEEALKRTAENEGRS
jgi:hypothetical protein